MGRTTTIEANVAFHRQLSPRYCEQPFFRPENQQRVRKLLCDLAEKTGGGRLLDIGCGTGFILELAHDVFNELDGVDITPEMLSLVTPRPNVRVQLALAEELPFENNHFDVVTAHSVLHHLADLFVVFREIRRVLRPGGIFFADESPSQDCREFLSKLQPLAPATEVLSHELDRLHGDPDRFLERYGIDRETTRSAMVQNYEVRGLTEQKLQMQLNDAGFRQVDIRFRRFLGEDEVKRDHGEAAVQHVEQYLQSILPLSRHLYKFFWLLAG